MKCLLKIHKRARADRFSTACARIISFCCVLFARKQGAAWLYQGYSFTVRLYHADICLSIKSAERGFPISVYRSVANTTVGDGLPIPFSVLGFHIPKMKQHGWYMRRNLSPNCTEGRGTRPLRPLCKVCGKLQFEKYLPFPAK